MYPDPTFTTAAILGGYLTCVMLLAQLAKQPPKKPPAVPPAPPITNRPAEPESEMEYARR